MVDLMVGKYHRDGRTPQKNFRIVEVVADRNPHPSRYTGEMHRKVHLATRSTLPIVLHGDEITETVG